MFSVLNQIRYRNTIFFIFGLIFIFSFGYDYTATNDAMAMWITKRQSAASQVVYSIINRNRQIQVNSSSINASLVSEDPSAYSTTPIPNDSTAAFYRTGNSSSSMNTSLVLEDPRTYLTTQNLDNLTAAFYQTGHSVSIPEKCSDSGNGLELLILIMSTPSNVQARQAIRLTWGHFGQRKDVRIAFVLGNVTTDSQIEDALLNEEEIYGDIIRGNFFDSYSNLPLKVISAFEWVTAYCPEAKFVLKTDDDMFINVPLLLEFIRTHSKERNVIFGRLADGWKPDRNKKSKYYLAEEEFDDEAFPNFTTGPAYLLSNDVIPKLYNATLKERYLKLEDVLITGIVAGKLGIRRLRNASFVNERVKFLPCKIRSSISIHSIEYNQQFDLWTKLFDAQVKCN